MQRQMTERQSRNRANQIGFGCVYRGYATGAEFVAESRKDVPEPFTVGGEPLKSLQSIDEKPPHATASDSLQQPMARLVENSLCRGLPENLDVPLFDQVL